MFGSVIVSVFKEVCPLKLPKPRPAVFIVAPEEIVIEILVSLPYALKVSGLL